MKKPRSLVKDNLQKMLKGMKTLTEQALYVGVPADEAARKEQETDEDELNNAALAYIHENGSPAANIPARPFMAPGMEQCKKEVAAELKKTATLALQGQAAVEKGYHRAGLIAQNSIRRVINEGPPPPLSELTLAARRARGRKGTKPLIDTSQLRNSITYVIRRK